LNFFEFNRSINRGSIFIRPFNGYAVLLGTWQCDSAIYNNTHTFGFFAFLLRSRFWQNTNGERFSVQVQTRRTSSMHD
jgi:hypothetical protein